MQLFLDDYIEQERKKAPQRLVEDINTLAMAAAIADCSRLSAKSLVLSKKTYGFRSKKAARKRSAASNNDSGEKSVLADLSGMEDFTIDGQGALLLFHDRLLPFYLKESRNITIQNLSIDYVYPFYLQGQITASGKDWLDLEIDREKFPYVVEEDTLFYEAEGYRTNRFYNVLEVNAESQLVEPCMGDDWGRLDRVALLDSDHIRIYKKSEKVHTVGNFVILQIENREYPAMILDGSWKIQVENVNIWQAYSMALLAQGCGDILVKDCVVGRKPGDERLVSASADALHFVNCSGEVRVQHCVFSHQMDDAINCHGIYMEVAAIHGKEVVAEAKHRQQYEVDIFRAGDTVSVLEHRSLKKKADGSIEKWERLDEKRIVLFLKEEIEGLQEGDLLENAMRMPKLYIEDCAIENMRARGVLVTTPKKVVIRHNYFHTSGSAILVEGDGNFWYESGAVEDIHIEENEFENCCYSKHPDWGQAVIQVSPKVFDRGVTDGFYHKQMRVENNRFHVRNTALIKAYQIERIIWDRNFVEEDEEKL